MGRPPRKLLGERAQIDPMTMLEGCLADAVLLGVMRAAQADRPSIGGFETLTRVGSSADMRAFNWNLPASGDAATMEPHPGAVRGT